MKVKEGTASVYRYHAVYEEEDRKAVCGTEVFAGEALKLIDPRTKTLRYRIFGEAYEPGPSGVGGWCSKCKKILDGDVS